MGPGGRTTDAVEGFVPDEGHPRRGLDAQPDGVAPDGDHLGGDAQLLVGAGDSFPAGRTGCKKGPLAVEGQTGTGIRNRDRRRVKREINNPDSC
jgi:hypothetical protein